MEDKETREMQYEAGTKTMKIKVTEARDIKDKAGEVIGNSQITMLQNITDKGIQDILTNLTTQKRNIEISLATIKQQFEAIKVNEADKPKIEENIRIMKQLQDYQKKAELATKLQEAEGSLVKTNKDLDELTKAMNK